MGLAAVLGVYSGEQALEDRRVSEKALIEWTSWHPLSFMVLAAAYEVNTPVYRGANP
jgi:hypothetical protein